MTITQGEPLYLGGNDFRPRQKVTSINTTTGAVEFSTGLTGSLTLLFKISATPDGAAINAALSKTAAEIGTTGQYTAVFEGTDLVTYLAAYAGLTVYEIFGDGANINAVVARKVEAVRWA